MKRLRSLRVLAFAGAFAAGGACLVPAVSPSASAAASSSAPADPTTPGPTLPALPVPLPPPADNEAEPQQYHGRIRIPAIELDAGLLEGIRLSTLDYGPGHWPGTAMPGELGNVVVAAHRTSHNADFRQLDELEPGDEIIFDLDDNAGTDNATVPADDTTHGVYVYAVTSVFRVPADGTWIVTQNYRHEATLFACHPPGSTSERIVVQADLVSIDGEPAPVPADAPRVESTATTLLEPAGD